MTDTRPPLRLTADQAANWFSLHGEDVGREIIIVESPVRGIPADQIGRPARAALGFNARGQWVWLSRRGKPLGRWP